MSRRHPLSMTHPPSGQRPAPGRPYLHQHSGTERRQGRLRRSLAGRSTWLGQAGSQAKPLQWLGKSLARHN